MGTTLTGTKPKDTYDSLIKVTDNGPLTGSLKKLTDGLGNDSSLSLSTTAASLSGTLAVTGATTFSSSLTANGLIKSTVAGAGFRHFYNNGAASIEVSQRSDSKLQLYAYTGSAYTDILLGVDGSTVGGNVGIGTSSPSVKLDVESGIEGITAGFAGSTYGLRIDNGGTFSTGGSTIHGVDPTLTTSYQPLRLNGSFTALCVSNTEVVRATANGLTFNGDTAAANALDDYEEGTWTIGVSFDGASVGVTTINNTGTYTKVGRKVTVNGLVTLSSKGSSTGAAVITGLPFTVGISDTRFYSVASLWMSVVTFANQHQGYANVNTTNIVLTEVTEAGAFTNLTNADFANNSEVMISLTYFV